MGKDSASQNAGPAGCPESRPLLRAVSEYVGTAPSRFHVPGHKGRTTGRETRAGATFADLLPYDVTELPGLDDLAAPDGPILELERRLARLYGASRSFFLVGGSTLGLQAAIMATAQDGDVVVVPRDAHRCVTAGLILSGASPYYVLPQVDERSGLSLGPAPGAYRDALETCARLGRRAVAVVVTNPNYYGVCSPDLAEVVRTCREYGAYCIVDEAHGPHLRFCPGAPVDGLGAGADIVVQSPHKMLTSMTQSAWMHVRDASVGDAALSEVVKSRLLLLQSSSPSYPLMCSLEDSVVFLEELPGAGLAQLANLADRARAESVALGYELYFGSQQQDPARLFLGAHAVGLTGEGLASALRCRGIHPELHSVAGCLLVLGPGTVDADIEALGCALRDIAAGSPAAGGGMPVALPARSQPARPNYPGLAGFSAMAPREAALAPWESVTLPEAVGRISAVSIAPSPPSIAIILPGDLITIETVDSFRASVAEKSRLHGTSDPSLRTISVVRHVHGEGGSSCHSRLQSPTTLSSY